MNDEENKALYVKLRGGRENLTVDEQAALGIPVKSGRRGDTLTITAIGDLLYRIDVNGEHAGFIDECRSDTARPFEIRAVSGMERLCGRHGSLAQVWDHLVKECCD